MPPFQCILSAQLRPALHTTGPRELERVLYGSLHCRCNADACTQDGGKPEASPCGCCATNGYKRTQHGTPSKPTRMRHVTAVGDASYRVSHGSLQAIMCGSPDSIGIRVAISCSSLLLWKVPAHTADSSWFPMLYICVPRGRLPSRGASRTTPASERSPHHNAKGN